MALPLNIQLIHGTMKLRILEDIHDQIHTLEQLGVATNPALFAKLVDDILWHLIDLINDVRGHCVNP
jgi:hypothetical protein